MWHQEWMVVTMEMIGVRVLGTTYVMPNRESAMAFTERWNRRMPACTPCTIVGLGTADQAWSILRQVKGGTEKQAEDNLL